MPIDHHFVPEGTIVAASVPGAILVGGRSTRMGADKASLALDGHAMAVHVARALLGAGVTDITLLGEPLSMELPALIEQLGCPLKVRPDSAVGAGPLAAISGMVSEVASRPDRPDRVVIVACDVPNLTSSVLAELLAVEAPIAMAATDRAHPTVAVWSTSVAGPLADLVASGERRLWFSARQLGSVEVNVADSVAVANFNEPDDLVRWRGATG
jgi:molybdenum cofactor guanylyltransferase